MTSPAPLERAPTDWKAQAMQKRIRRRYGAERRFKLLGLGAVALSAAFLAFLLFVMAANGARGFTRSEIALDIDFPALALPRRPRAARDPRRRSGACRRRPGECGQGRRGRDLWRDAGDLGTMPG